MTSADPDFLYRLLPEYLRFRDVGEGEPLRALFRVLAGEFQRLSNNMDALYDDWFIETCADWVVPYIGELVGVRGLDRPGGYHRSERSLVGNALRNRRRKGVPTVLGEAASEATGWPILAVPAIPHLATTQTMAHPEPRRRMTVSLRDAPALALLGTPFDTLAHTASVTAGRERWNLPGVGLFRWRLQSYPVERAALAPVSSNIAPAGCYAFHPFGIDSPLFNRPGTGEAPSPLPSPAAFPGPLTRRQLQSETALQWAGRAEPFTIFVLLAGQAEPVVVGPSDVVAADLSTWRRPAAPPAPQAPPAAPAPSSGGQPPLRVAVDPELGRLALASGIDAAEVAEVRASYCYGFGADLGGGPYARPERTFERPSPGANIWQAEVAIAFASAAYANDAASAPQAATPARFGSLDAALAAWPAGMDGAIRILDNSTYEVTKAISLATSGGDRKPPQPRRLSIAAAQGARPCLRGDLAVSGPARRPAQPAAAPAGQRLRGAAELDLSGLWIDGGIVLSGEVNVLRIVHTTLRPKAPAGAAAAAPPASVRLATAADPPSALEVQIAECIVGPLQLPAALLALEVLDSIVDGGAGGAAIHGYGAERLGPTAVLARATIFGEVRLRQLVLAQDVLFTAPVFVERCQQGEVRFSYLPAGSRTPRCVHCLSEADGGAPLRPVFTATAYGAPGYAQLDGLTPPAIRTGSERGSEIGVFESLDQAARSTVLGGVVADYLRWGMYTEIVDVT